MKRVWVAALVTAMSLAVSQTMAQADVCQPCTEKPADPKMHGRSLKSYWGVAKGDAYVLGKAFEQGHLGLCGAPDEWEWNMFMGMVSAELGKALYNQEPNSPAQAESLRTEAAHKLEYAGCYFAQAMKFAVGKNKEKVGNNLEHYWVEQYNEAINYFKQDALDKALERLDSAIKIDPSNCKGYGLKGPTLIKLERYEDAIATLEKGRSLCPNDSTISVNLFAALHNRGNELFNLASKAQGDSAKNFYTQALEWYKKASEIDPNHVTNLYQTGMAHLRLVDLGDKASMEPAAKNLEAFLDKAQDPEDKARALYYLTWIQVEGKDWDKAEKYVDQYLALAPKDADGYRFKSIISGERKGPEASQGYLIFFTVMDKGKVVEPSGTVTGGEVGKLIQDKGKPEEIRAYTDSKGNMMVSAFYWSKGEGYAFYRGQKLGSVTFPAQNP